MGGVILFSRNFRSIKQLMVLIKAIKAIKNPGLLVSVDQEGGRVQRFKAPFYELPKLSAIGDIFDRDPARAKRLARDHAWVMSMELLAVNIDFSFAPVVDLRSEKSEVIGDRAFHENPEIVKELSKIYVETMEGNGMKSVAKHFPGHGLIKEDSHLTTPVDSRELNSIINLDLMPYQTLVKLNLDAIMMAHIIYQKVDSKPAGFSKIWMRDILRSKFDFNGLIFSDDLSMRGAAVSSSFFERAKLAVEAGCDALIVCNNRAGVKEILDSATSLKIFTDKCQSLEIMEAKDRRVSLTDLTDSSEWKEAVTNLDNLTHDL